MRLQWTENQWNQSSEASAVRPGTTGVVHVCTGFIAEMVGEAAGSGALWQLLDGTTTLLAGRLQVGVASNVDRISITDMEIPGTVSNSMSLNVTVASGTVNVSASLIGYDL